MANSKIKFFYFDARGRGEVCRLVLALAGKEYEDIRWTREQWQEGTYKADAPFGQAPYIDIDGKKYGQSSAIATYLAKEFGLYGKSNVDALRIDEVVQLHGDVMQVLIKGFTEQDETKKAELGKKLVEEELPKFFGFFQKLLRENGTGVFVGKELTLADLYVYDLMFSLKKLRDFDAAAKYPELKTLQEKVESNPRLKAYLDNRKETPF
nr:hypothetical protein BaRGS_034649 [Batillaria attramentaria]